VNVEERLLLDRVRVGGDGLAEYQRDERAVAVLADPADAGPAGRIRHRWAQATQRTAPPASVTPKTAGLPDRRGLGRTPIYAGHPYDAIFLEALQDSCAEGRRFVDHLVSPMIG
jgi:hypothetical protein